MRSSMTSTKCRKWIHERCTKVQRVSKSMAESFACSNCIDAVSGITVEPIEKLSDHV